MTDARLIIDNHKEAKTTHPKTPQSDHFTYYEPAEGVWAHGKTHRPGGEQLRLDLGDRTLVFDTTLSPASAADLRTTAESLTGRSVACVLTSHGDTDHVFGNAAFPPETEIYATARTCELVMEKTATDNP
jgi:glyoxylase-like metal-dependent hydrolase (beta-lactamase superfamily II)